MSIRNSRGFMIIEFLLLVAVLIGIGIVVWKFVVTKKSAGPQTASQISANWSNGKCQGSGTVPLTASPIALDHLDSIAPMGNMVGNHVTPSDHLGFAPDNPAADTPIRAMADGFVVKLEFIDEPSKDWYGVLINATVAGTSGIPIDVSDQSRSRKLLAKRREIAALIAAKQQGKTIVPLEILTGGRFIKLRISMGKGKNATTNVRLSNGANRNAKANAP